MSVRALRRGSIAASRVAAPAGGTFTIFGDGTDGYVAANIASGDGGGSAVSTTGDAFVGQRADGSGWESFIAFDTSLVTGTIQSATLSLWGKNNSSDTDFTLEVRLYDWGSTVTEADWRARATLSTLTLLASVSTASWAVGSYIDLTSEAAFLSNINTSGMTRMVVCSSRHRNGDSPGGNEYVAFAGGDASGTSNDPKLVVVST